VRNKWINKFALASTWNNWAKPSCCFHLGVWRNGLIVYCIAWQAMQRRTSLSFATSQNDWSKIAAQEVRVLLLVTRYFTCPTTHVSPHIFMSQHPTGRTTDCIELWIIAKMMFWSSAHLCIKIMERLLISTSEWQRSPNSSFSVFWQMSFLRCGGRLVHTFYR